MKFKTKEEFNKEHGYSDSGENFIVNEIFNSFAERVEFYKKYANFEGNLKTLQDEKAPYKKLWEEQPQVAEKYIESKEDDYDMWLFDYCFGDVV